MIENSNPAEVPARKEVNDQPQVYIIGRNRSVGLDKETVFRFFDHVNGLIAELQGPVAHELKYEIKAAASDLLTGRPIAVRLHAIGGMMKQLQLDREDAITITPAYEQVKSHLGL